MGKAIDFVPGFEGVPSLLAFLLAASITQSVRVGGLTAGSDTALDIQTGFFDRLLASPVPRTTILVGRLARPVDLDARGPDPWARGGGRRCSRTGRCRSRAY